MNSAVRLTLRSLRKGYGAAWSSPQTGSTAMGKPMPPMAASKISTCLALLFRATQAHNQPKTRICLFLRDCRCESGIVVALAQPPSPDRRLNRLPETAEAPGHVGGQAGGRSKVMRRPLSTEGDWDPIRRYHQGQRPWV